VPGWWQPCLRLNSAELPLEPKLAVYGVVLLSTGNPLYSGLYFSCISLIHKSLYVSYLGCVRLHGRAALVRDYSLSKVLYVFGTGPVTTNRFGLHKC
jgi:hypothetical protein